MGDATKESLPEVSLEQESVQSLVHAAKHLQKVSQVHMQMHADRIAKHAQMIQSASAAEKAKAYAHNFNNSKKAIRSALKALTNQLNAGHKHDVNALRLERNRGNGIIGKANNRGKGKVMSFRAKACPTKRLEDEARAKKDAARKSMHNLGNGKICSGGLGTTFGDMDRDKFNKSRGKYAAATKAHKLALQKYNVAMAQFKTALRIEVSNAQTACSNAHKEYEALKKEVASNVNSRKNVFISTLVITCYVDNITSNASAKACANKKRRASTNQWNINGGTLARCPSKAHLEASFGPKGWQPTKRTCHHSHWNEKSYKKAMKEKAAKHKEKAAKEKKHKALARSNVLSCTSRGKHSNNAGVIIVPTLGGRESHWRMTGGGMNNHYRSFNKLSAFEEMYPRGHSYACDTGFGPGRLTCYAFFCKAKHGYLNCNTWASRKRGSGSAVAQVPKGYTMTGGGLVNHYRHFNARAGFEESFPYGNGWRGDMGFGWGDFTVYARGCKATVGKLSCYSATHSRPSNAYSIHCKAGYKVTGCGIYNAYRHWNKLGAFEETRPHGNGCHCDMGFGSGQGKCYVRCCKITA